MTSNINLSVFHNCENYSFYPPLKKQILMNNFRVKVIELLLFKYVKIAVLLFDNEGNPIEQKIYILEGEDYTKWSDDDTYIIQYVKKQLRNAYEKTTAENVVVHLKKALNKKGDDKPQDNFIVDTQLYSQDSKGNLVRISSNNVVDSETKTTI